MIGTLLGPLLHLGGPIVSRAAMYTGSLVGGRLSFRLSCSDKVDLHYRGIRYNIQIP